MSSEEDIRNIQERNQRVENDKAWEMSLTRRSSIMLFTYVLAAIWLASIDNPKPLLTALIPSVGYFISTLTLPLVKDWWLKNRK